MSELTFPPIPADTAQAAQTVFGRTNFYLAAGDHANSLFSGLVLEDSTGWFHNSPRALAQRYLITIFQYIETLPDSMVADALRERLDWKYALHLSLGYAYLEPLSLCEFRKKCLEEPAVDQNFQILLQRLAALSPPIGQQLLDVPTLFVIPRVCTFSRMAKVWDALNHALQVLAIQSPEWLITISQPHWFERYSRQHRSYTLNVENIDFQVLAQTLGSDASYLLRAISEANQPALLDLPEIIALKTVFHDQYKGKNERVSWREAACSGCNMAAKIREHTIRKTKEK